MGEGSGQFRYVAVAPNGRRVKGVISAANDAGAFEHLRREGLSPLHLRPVRTPQAHSTKVGRISERDTAALLRNLGELLNAGADMRTALDILGSRAARPAVTQLCQNLIADISGGDALELAFSRHLGRHQGMVSAMLAAGQVAGKLPDSLARAAGMIEARMRLQAKFTSILAYPAFVLLSTIGAVFALLLFVVPALEPLVRNSGGDPPVSLKIMIAASTFLRAQSAFLGAGVAAIILLGLASYRLGLLAPLMERVLLDGPTRRVTRAIVFGNFAITLGGMLAADAPMSDALRLSVRSIGFKVARARLEPLVPAVRQGQTLSRALDEVPSFPRSVAQLASVGEATGALGEMLARAGQLEEDDALGRIELIGQILGPAMIVALGGIVGLLMAGLLSGVSQLGQSAVQ